MDLAGTISVKSHKMQGNDFKTNCNPNGVTIPSALARANDDALVARTIALSRYARRLLAAEPGLMPATAALTATVAPNPAQNFPPLKFLLSTE